LKGNSGKFDEGRSENAAVINYPNVPVYAFVRADDKAPFTFKGSFYCKSINTEPDGSKWFELNRKDFATDDVLVTSLVWNEDFSNKVEASRAASSEERKKRLKGVLGYLKQERLLLWFVSGTPT
jgi:5-methylcytosine-specific restriction protein A